VNLTSLFPKRRGANIGNGGGRRKNQKKKKFHSIRDLLRKRKFACGKEKGGFILFRLWGKGKRIVKKRRFRCGSIEKKRGHYPSTGKLCRGGRKVYLQASWEKIGGRTVLGVNAKVSPLIEGIKGLVFKGKNPFPEGRMNFTGKGRRDLPLALTWGSYQMSNLSGENRSTGTGKKVTL